MMSGKQNIRAVFLFFFLQKGYFYSAYNIMFFSVIRADNELGSQGLQTWPLPGISKTIISFNSLNGVMKFCHYCQLINTKGS
jgi:hypothetical protein